MALEEVCSPAIIYVAFSIIHILIDVFKNMYNAALVKFIIMIVFTILLNILCSRGLGIVSWFIVFIPFITMTLLSQLILVALQMSKSSTNDKPISYIDEINMMRTKTSSEPAPVTEYSDCKSQKCKPGNAYSDYTINLDENVGFVTDENTMTYDESVGVGTEISTAAGTESTAAGTESTAAGTESTAAGTESTAAGTESTANETCPA
jgi:hypothetical protein